MSIFPPSDVRAMIAEFGEQVTINSQDAIAVIDEPFSDEFGISGNNPTATISSELNVSINQALVCARTSKSYLIKEIKPEGDGFTVLTLEEQ